MKKSKYVRKHNPDRPTKHVRVDPRTIIVVDVDTPDEVAIERYKEHRQINAPVCWKHSQSDNYFIKDY